MDNDYAYRNLASAIVLQAVTDFKRLAKKYKSGRCNKELVEEEMRSIVGFVKSKWFTCLTDINPELVLKKLQEELK